jgi:para-aminobenzoate synthetase component 1
MNLVKRVIDVTNHKSSELADRFAALAPNYNRFCLLDSCSFNENNSNQKYDWLVGIDAITDFQLKSNNLITLQSFLDDNKGSWIFGHLNYDLKNVIEPKLSSKNSLLIDFPLCGFFVPKFTFTYFNAILLAWYDEIYSLEFDKLLSLILDPNESQSPISNNESLRTAELKLISFEKYNQQIDKIKHHLNRGDSYELNYCIPLLLQTKISPVSIQRKLKDNSPAPFSAFYKHQNNWLISASPERFIKKNGDKLISQPIKGTARRNGNLLEDEKVKKELLTSEKERAENIMITDLVRNDLSKVATRNSVHVDELCGLYSFAQVFQLITTISCQLRPQVDFIQIINALFPMGSMTGAPKFRSMEIIDDLEDFHRGIFSGSVGYISPEGDFDFNVVIRSIFYDEKNEEILIAAGSAITLKSNSEDEYNECLLKANAMLKVLGLDVTSLNIVK